MGHAENKPVHVPVHTLPLNSTNTGPNMRYEYVLQHNKITVCQYRLYRSVLVCLWAMLKSNRCTHRCIHYPLSVQTPVQIRMHLTMHRLQTSTHVHKCLSAKGKTNELRGRVVGALPRPTPNCNLSTV